MCSVMCDCGFHKIPRENPRDERKHNTGSFLRGNQVIMDAD